MKASPIIKWAGGKGRVLPELRKRLPSSYRRYFEPFAGGAALFFDLEPRVAVLADSNANLVNLYRYVALEPKAVINHLGHHQYVHCKDHYYRTRARWNTDPTLVDAERAATFIYLNRTCYNGLWRVNKKGHYNVPMGDYESPKILDADAIHSASQALAHVLIVHCDYREAVRGASKGDLIYFDPPYDGTFVGYTKEGFGAEAQEQLADTVKDLVRRGCHVLVSNSDTPRVRELYRDFRIDSIKVGRAINSAGSKRGKVGEVIVVADLF